MHRGNWANHVGFVLAAAGSAIGLGNVWRFPYVTGENGGGAFVLIYLAAVLLIGLPIMMAEILIGRESQSSPVGAFRALSRPGSPWILIGWMGVAAGFIILSFYSVVAGWTLRYMWLSITGAFSGKDAADIGAIFGQIHAEPVGNVVTHSLFMLLTIGIVIGGIQKGLERWVRILMPALFVTMVLLLIRATSMSGFGAAMSFVFGTHFHLLTTQGVLEAMGQAFFSLSLGMGAMLTYGSYLRRTEDIVAMSTTVAVLDTVIALAAAMVLFPIIFSAGLPSAAGPGLVFVSLPIAFSHMPLGGLWATAFFALLAFAALTSTISLLEVAVSYLIDERSWTRVRATLTCGLAILVLGIPSALSGGDGIFGAQFAHFTERFFGQGHGKTWFDTFDYFANNWMLPLGGLGIASFVAWRIGDKAREEAFKTGSRYGKVYWIWVQFLRYVVPVAVLAVFLNAIGLI
jgi:NSS family neurotransmitter:Na+ symporter